MNSLTITNSTTETIYIAVFNKPNTPPSLNAQPFVITQIPPTHKTVITPHIYSVYVNYGDQTDPNGGKQTKPIEFYETTARFLVESVPSGPAGHDTIKVTQVFNDLVLNEIHIDNESDQGVWAHTTNSGIDIIPPQTVSPGSALLLNMTGSQAAPAGPIPVYYLAVISKPSGQENYEVVSTAQVQILLGQTGTVTGTEWTGYTISVS